MFVGFILFSSLSLKEEKKINGMSFEAPSKRIEAQEFKSLLMESNSEWVALMPYAYSNGTSPKINYENLVWQWWGEGYEGTKSCIRDAHSQGLKVMLKPHLWIKHGSFTGDVKFDSAEDWEIWEEDYLNYILKYAKLAEQESVEMFCFGTELKTWFLNRPDSWEVMIQDIRKVYSGELTYAGNWDGYKLFPFWDQLDYIGVDAYFPLSNSTTPSVDELSAGWKEWMTEMEKLSKRFNRKILFTEFGYRNIDYTASKPWESYKVVGQNDQAQKNAYIALFENVWDEPWMAGGFAWKWHAKSHQNGKNNTKYSPQGKPALEVLRNFYAK